MPFSRLGRITDISEMDKGYKRLILSINIPFKTKLLKFNVWKDHLLQDENLVNFKVGDDVCANYHYNKGYPCLDKLTSTSIDNCPVCYNNVEATDAQRIDCHGCSTMPESLHKLRVNARFKLKSCVQEQFQYSSGYKLKFENEEASEQFTCVIFQNNPLFVTVPNFKVSDLYYVVGWKNTENSDNYFVDVIDMY